MRTRIQLHRSSAVLILAFFVLMCDGGDVKAQTDSSCSREGSSRSAQTTQAAKLTLINQTQETLTGYWLDFEGKRQKWFDLATGQALELSTFVGHLWLVTKANGQCLAIYSAPGNFRVGKPQSPVFSGNKPPSDVAAKSPATDRPPTNATADQYYDLGKKHWERGGYDRANELFKKAIALKSSLAKDVSEHYFFEGFFWAGEENYERALFYYRPALQLRPDWVRAHIFAGYAYDKLKRYPEAVASYRKAIELRPDVQEPKMNLNAAAHHALGLTYLAMGQRALAQEVHRALLAIDKTKAGELLAEINKVPAAASTGKPANAPANNPTSASAEAYFAQAEKYLEAKDYANAVEAYNKAISLKPSASANLGLGVSYFHLKRFQEGLAALSKAYRQAPKNDPSLYVIHYWIGKTYIAIQADQIRRNIITEEDPLEMAAGAFEEALRLKPDHIESKFELGFVYLVTGEFEEAVKALNTVIRLRPKDAEAHYYLGLAYMRLGKKNEALQVYRKLLTLDQEWAQKLYAEINKPK